VLIEFRVTNFRSFKDTQVLNMTASTATEWQTSHTFESGQPSFPRMLRSAVLYGPNAAGKTNLLSALQFVQAFVLGSAASQEGHRIFVKPFLFDKNTRGHPSEFELVFVEEQVRYQYGFTVDAERVQHEWLIAYPKGRPQRLFEREYSSKSKKYTWTFSSNLKGDHLIWRNATRSNALFLSTAVQLNSEQLKPVFHWFQHRLVVVAGATQLNPGLTIGLLKTPDGKAKVMRFVRNADLGIDDIALKSELIPAGMIGIQGIQITGPAPGASGAEFDRVQTLHKVAGDKEPVTLEMSDESSGTNKIINSAGAWLKVLTNGEVLFIDELDNSLHPMIVRFLIGLFHSVDANKKNAQIFFSTHDTSLLDGDLFRRDQIWFTEKDKRNASHLYPLLDFSPRKEEALGKGYLKGRYGALPFIGEPRF
jgi:AAA15 family ATPase/GTPase